MTAFVNLYLSEFFIKTFKTDEPLKNCIIFFFRCLNVFYLFSNYKTNINGIKMKIYNRF